MDERRKSPAQETIDNSIAISKLTAISETTTKDVDRLVKHIERFLPVHEKLSNLKKILYVSISLAAVFGVWISREHYKVSEKIATHLAVQEEKETALKNEIKKNNSKASRERNYNKNQITYLKGRIKQ